MNHSTVTDRVRGARYLYGAAAWPPYALGWPFKFKGAVSIDGTGGVG